MNNELNIINQLNQENYIFIIFIALSFLNIFGDELIKKAVIKKEEIYFEHAKTIFFIVIFISIIIYIYFINRNYKDYQKYKDNQSYKIRLLGSILILVGTLCFLYFQITIFNNTESLSNI